LGEMKNIYRQRTHNLFGIVLLAVASACSSLPSPSTPGPISENPPDQELTLAGADSQVFEAVVRAQLAAGDDDYPHHLDPMRLDARPYGTSSGYPEQFAGVEGIDPTLSFARADQRVIDRVIENRKRILDARDVPSGGPIAYQQCAGASVPTPPPPPRGSKASRAKPVDVHAGCPRAPKYYLTVGLPIRGQPEGVKNTRDARGRRVSLGGEVWTVLVDEHSASPEGWKRSQYAWMFTRNRSGQLELAGAVLIGVID
jgi:hypothetical protein